MQNLTFILCKLYGNLMFILLHGFAKTVQYTVFTFSHKTIDNIKP